MLQLHLPVPRVQRAAIRCLALVIGLGGLGGLGLSASGCNSTTNTVLPSTPQQLLNDTFSGTVPAAVNGVLQSDLKTVTTTQSGTVIVSLSSAVETLPGGASLPNVALGVGIGTPSGGSCSIAVGNSTTAQPSSAAVLSGTLPAGPFCVQVSDVTNQTGPVAYALVVTHPQ